MLLVNAYSTQDKPTTRAHRPRVSSAKAEAPALPRSVLLKVFVVNDQLSFFADQCFCKNIIETLYQKKKVTHLGVTTSAKWL